MRFFIVMFVSVFFFVLLSVRYVSSSRVETEEKIMEDLIGDVCLVFIGGVKIKY